MPNNVKNARLANNLNFFLLLTFVLSGFRCKGLILLETHSVLGDQELLERLPTFLDIEGEVTGYAAYSMFNLSLVENWEKSNKFCF